MAASAIPPESQQRKQCKDKYQIEHQPLNRLISTQLSPAITIIYRFPLKSRLL
jgi:hypothetical protein